MYNIAPNYYYDFTCIANKCKHNCCLGWEIDIDDCTYEKYKSSGGSLSERLHNSIDTTGGVPHFKLMAPDERCPFLNSKNLCDIIIEMGEDNLCDICKDHPRFRNYFDDRIELGIGLCCEAAAKIILSPDKSVDIKYNGIDPFFYFRQSLFGIISNTQVDFPQRIYNAASKFNITIKCIKISDVAKMYNGLEYMSDEWNKLLNELKNDNRNIFEIYLINFSERRLHYFIYRHLAQGQYDDTLLERFLFSFFSTQFICAMTSYGVDIYEAARMYSSEIEYSDENIDMLINKLHSL